MYIIHAVIIIFELIPGLLPGTLLPLKLSDSAYGTGRVRKEVCPDWLMGDDVTMTSLNLQVKGDGKERSGGFCLSDDPSSEVEGVEGKGKQLHYEAK